MSHIDLDQLYADVADLTTRHHDGRSHSRGLIAELQDVAGRTLTATGSSEIRGGKPGSRPPSAESNNALDLLAEIEAGVWQHDADLRDALDSHLNYDRPWLTALGALPGLAGRLPDAEGHPLAVALAKAVQGWRRAALVVLRHVAPMSKLDAACNYCGQQSLIVRSDASSDVVCVTPDCVDERGETPRWTRQTWVLLLNQEAS